MTRRILRSISVLVLAGLLVMDFSNAVSAHRSSATLRQVAAPAFVFPTDGAAYSTTSPYIFKVKPISRATGYLWSFVQGGVVVYQNLAWDGHLSPPDYTVLPGSEAHKLIHAGDLQVQVRALLADGQWSATANVSVRIQAGGLHQPPAPTPTQGRTYRPGTKRGCQFQTAHRPLTVAFCETFDHPAGIGNRSGGLNGTLWGVSRTGGNTPGQGQVAPWLPTMEQRCSQSVLVQPENDVTICNGQMVEATNDGGGVTTLAMYPKQPFDIAGRTGTVTFDVSNDSQGGHMAWPEFWYTNKPVPAPFTHEGTWVALPQNGLGIRFNRACAPGQGGNCACLNGNNTSDVFTVDSAIVVSDYAYREIYSLNGTQLKALDCVRSSTGPGNMNHIELHISQNEVDVYATDAGTTSPLKKIAVLSNANLTLTRGLIWLEDVHYNANKEPGTQGTHTFTWDNVGFDGPRLPRDLAFDVHDRLTPNNLGGVNLGWEVPSDGTTLSLTVPGVHGIAQASGALITLNYFPYSTLTLSYSLNGKAWHSLRWPFPDKTTYTWRTIAIAVSLSEIRPGNNMLQLKSNDATTIANVDLILQGAGGVVAPTG